MVHDIVLEAIGAGLKRKALCQKALTVEGAVGIRFGRGRSERLGSGRGCALTGVVTRRSHWKAARKAHKRALFNAIA